MKASGRPENPLRLYAGKRVLLTGHTGFKGAWLAFWLQKLGAEVHGYALDEPGAPAAYTGLGVARLLASETRADLADREKLRACVAKVRPDAIFHLAAQSLVRASYRDPLETLKTNFMGTAYLLDILREASVDSKVDRPMACVVVTSDKCYENREWVYGYRENDAMGGHDPYSMSKGACELLVAAYRHSYFPPEDLGRHGVALASARAGNVIGGGDYAEDRILPDAVRALRVGNPVPVRNPRSVRPWQHVLEPVSGYLALGAELLGRNAPRFCEGWNFGPAPDVVLTVQDVVEEFLAAWGSGSWKAVGQSGDGGNPAAREPHEARLLSLSIDKAAALLSWIPKWDARAALRLTAEAYRVFEGADRREGSMREVALQQIERREG